MNCPTGQYSDVFGVTDCKDCNIGFYTDERGLILLTSCKKCGLGRFSDATGGSLEIVACKRCPVGLYSKTLPTLTNPVLLEECADCPAGRYGNSTGLIAVDTSTDAPTGAYCLACDAGKYLETTGNISSTDCVLWFFFS